MKKVNMKTVLLLATLGAIILFATGCSSANQKKVEDGTEKLTSTLESGAKQMKESEEQFWDSSTK